MAVYPLGNGQPLTASHCPRLLVSARDPGAAQALLPLLKLAQRQTNLTCQVIAQQPALQIFCKSGIEATPVNSEPVQRPTDPGAKALLSEARALLGAACPDAILVGISGPGIGIDEALLAEAGARPTFSLEDYPGYRADGFGVRAQTVFVQFANTQDDASSLAERRIYAGSFASESLASVNPQTEAMRWRALAHCQKPVVALIGQPLHDKSWYVNSLLSAGRAVKRTTALGDTELFYRPHPKETTSERRTLIAALSSYGVRVTLDEQPSIVGLLCAADVVISCFSSAGLDHLALNSRSAKPLGGVLFLAMYDELADCNDKPQPAELPWTVGHGLSVAALSYEDLPGLLTRLSSHSYRHTVWQKARDRLPAGRMPSEIVLETIMRAIAKRRSHTPG